MRSLWFAGPGKLEWREVPRPRLAGESDALVRPVIAARCAIDRLIVTGESPLTGPFPIGHEAVGRVVETGSAVTRVSVGDYVVISPNIACGHCDRCLRGRTAHCRSTPPGAAYGFPAGGNWGGLYDDLVRVPAADAMLTPIPGGTAATVADLAEFVVAGDTLGLGYEIIPGRLAEGRDRILVLGWAEHGLYQAAFATALGAADVLYVDDDPVNRRLAETMGARVAPGPPDRSHGRFDLVVAATPDPVWLRRAFHLLEPEGVVDSIGGFADPTLPAWAMYGLSAVLRVYRGNHGPDSVKATVDAVARRLVRPSTVYSGLVDWEDIPAAMTGPGRKPVAVRAGVL
ncbi:alcohol dehydrogenase catalytic domain-containing protein [Amycolatopsis sp.]|uniref:alcohol dehydrogenase catalytic domain-containing protein n=1 Tax=Amycolatopsis sp. TaxID=37632 RepID=UPI002CAFB367|nr:alcohol dehydrogenase catalytic domain-containing protein [Amycolatopsis sp.]HVV08272.1 alcohol dehydrogenase catalytic domain-containing protein [Amycolatopsis sp.]